MTQHRRFITSLSHRPVQIQLAAAANAILTLIRPDTLAEGLPGASIAVRRYSRSSDSDGGRRQRLVTSYLKSVLSSLSIPHGELDQLAASPLFDAALTAWALTKTASHPALEEAAAASQKLQQLLIKLDGAMLWQQQAAASPLGQLLWHVAVSVSRDELRGMSVDDHLAQLVEYQVVLAANSGTAYDDLLNQLPKLTDTPVTAALNHPEFWQFALSAAQQHEVLAQDLLLLAYDVAAAASSVTGQLQQIEQLLGVSAAGLQQQLAQELHSPPSILLPGQEKQLLAAVAHHSQARQHLAQLQLLQLLAQALGLSTVHVTGAPTAPQLVTRLTGVAGTQHAVDPSLLQRLSAVGPQLLSAVSQVPVKALEQPSVGGLLKLMNDSPQLQHVAEGVSAWRAAAAAAGYLPVLTTLSHTEVAALSKEQAAAVAQAIMQLEAQGRLLLRKAAAQQLASGRLSEADAAALAWKVHTGGQPAIEELTRLVLAQAAEVYDAAVSKLDSAAAALTNMAAGFQLEDATSRLSSAAPPSPLVLAGVPQHQVAELSMSFPALTSSTTSSSPAASSATVTAEALVRDLASLLAPPDSRTPGQRLAGQRLQMIAHDLPKVLSGALLDLLAVHQTSPSAGVAALQQHQQRLRAFMAVLDAELPRLAAVDSSADVGGSSSSWSAGGTGGVSVSGAEGVLELLGEQDTRQLLQHALELGHKRTQGQQEQQGIYEQLADIHHDIDVQRYLQMEFDPALDVDVIHAPHGWRDSELWVNPPEFLDGMKPLLDKYLEAQGEAAVTDMEWQVYRDSALTEHEQFEVSAAAARSAAGHSPFNNSRADEAYLTQRLEAGIPKNSVLYAAAHKYLKASFKNRTWRFAQRRRMVDRLVEIAAHLAAHPPRTHRGSPFSPLFQPNGPPPVPRLTSKTTAGKAARSSAAQGEAYALPEGFGRSTAHG
eukprot:GHUV01003630.1.p1 GENE.GHUV01003630.1~~GHUV01003630.1.p1  ORF type:complete len:938 (+),score=439.83 GHUV01003630.1:187-3000(+)